MHLNNWLKLIRSVPPETVLSYLNGGEGVDDVQHIGAEQTAVVLPLG